MPRVSIWLIRTSLLCLVLGFTLGGTMLAGKGLGFSAWLAQGIPVHVELVVLGWMVQLAMGVALWILPRFGARGPARGAAWGWAAWALLNTGIILVIAAAFSRAAPADLRLAGRLLELGAAVAFGGAIWTRVRASGISAM